MNTSTPLGLDRASFGAEAELAGEDVAHEGGGPRHAGPAHDQKEAHLAETGVELLDGQSDDGIGDAVEDPGQGDEHAHQGGGDGETEIADVGRVPKEHIERHLHDAGHLAERDVPGICSAVLDALALNSRFLLLCHVKSLRFSFVFPCGGSMIPPNRLAMIENIC